MRIAPFDEQRHGFAHHRDEVHEQRLAQALLANAERASPHGLHTFSFYFRSVLRGPAQHGRSARDVTRIRSSDASARSLTGLSSSTHYFSTMRSERARNRQMIRHDRTARSFPIRPHRKIAFSKGNPGIFSHFLRNYR
ncbi:hypothetical protein [Burkholderia diffusa]|uniref:hypothetical protein n=1 Tax=Burkholderia diffusa TaxID=488732 RepID=UPI00158834D6|nr:hypothetical protein [Burkholderia diffusa]